LKQLKPTKIGAQYIQVDTDKKYALLCVL